MSLKPNTFVPAALEEIISFFCNSSILIHTFIVSSRAHKIFLCSSVSDIVLAGNDDVF